MGDFPVRQVAPLIKKGRSCCGGTWRGVPVRVTVRLSPPGFADRELADKIFLKTVRNQDATIKNN